MLVEPFVTVDLGVCLDQAAYPPWGFKAHHIPHVQGARAMSKFLNLRDFKGGAVSADDFPAALGLAWSQVSMSDHAGNHIDAPYHFGPVVEGRPARTIDQVPLEWCVGPGVRLDFRGRAGQDVGVDDLRRELERVEVELRPGMIPLLWTGADRFVDDPDRYWQAQAGLSVAGLHWLLDQGVRLVGIDAYAMDVSHATMQRDVARAQEGDDAPLFPLHFVGREREHLHLEKLANLGALPRAHGFLFVAFPVKLRGGSAGWVRPVALVPRRHFGAQEDS
ncbi:MAG: cyclase family protein [Planctomycetes bacterium]|nr:cyclase family protein [Planctomycetota bacterium]